MATWSSFGESFLIENCQSCHSSSAQNRYGAPQNVYFDSHEDAVFWAERILEVSLGEVPSMPPGGGVVESDLDLLQDWLICWGGQ